MSKNPAPADAADEIDRDTHGVEGFSDGFFAIVTLLVIDLRLPEASTLLLSQQFRIWGRSLRPT